MLKAQTLFTQTFGYQWENLTGEERVKLLTPYRITMDMLKMTGNADNGQLIFMHCLPAFHDTELNMVKKSKKIWFDRNGSD